MTSNFRQSDHSQRAVLAWKRPEMRRPTDHRKLYARFLGVVLLLGFVWPVVVERDDALRVVPASIEGLFAEGVPWGGRFLLLYPLLAGVAVLLLVAYASDAWRARGLICLALLPFLILLADSGFREAFGRAVGKAGSGPVTWLAVTLVGSSAMLGGSVARWYRPESRRAWGVALVGAVAYLVSLVMPVMPAEAGRFPLFSALRTIHQNPTLFTVAVLGLHLLCLVTGVALALSNTRSTEPDRAKTLAGAAAMCLLAAMGFACIYPAGVLFGVAQPVLGDHADTFVFFWWVKGLLLGVGAGGLIPVGIIDLTVCWADRELTVHVNRTDG